MASPIASTAAAATDDPRRTRAAHLRRRARPGLWPAQGLLLATLIGCAPPSPVVPDHLAPARTAVEAARREPVVRALAPAELDGAEVALVFALEAAERGAPALEVDHFAYIAEQRAAIALARAAERRAERESAKLRRTRHGLRRATGDGEPGQVATR